MATSLTLVIVVMIMIQGVDRAQGNPPPPAIGDILLVPYDGEPKLTDFYEVLIYNSDGESRADYGGVCADKSYEEEARVICRQLGYQYNDFGTRTTSSPVWFNHIQCDSSNTPHILRCKNTVTSSEERNSNTVCGPDNYRLLVKCDFTKPLDPYDGQVALCPVDLTNNNISSTSFGLVGMYYKRTVTGAWKGINQKDGKLLGAYEADTICRQMGFTGAYPGTAVTRKVDNYSFSHCFSDTGTWLPFRFHHGSWVTTSDITCQQQQTCLQCCLQYTPRGTCGTTQCYDMDNLVIRCAFDPTKIKLNQGTAGSEENCKLDSNKNVGQCESADNSLKMAFGLVATFLGLLVLCECFCLCYCYKIYLHDRCREWFTARFRRNEHEPLLNPQPIQNRQNAQNEDQPA